MLTSFPFGKRKEEFAYQKKEKEKKNSIPTCTQQSVDAHLFTPQQNGEK